MLKRNYIGLACTGHDNAIAIVNERGAVVFAEAAERYLQNKRALGSPPDDMVRIGELIDHYCDPDAELVMAKSWSDQASTKLLNEKLNLEQKISHVRALLNMSRGKQREAQLELLLDNMKQLRDLTDFVRRNIDLAGINLLHRCRERIIHQVAFDHHHTHAAQACFASPFEEAICVVVDGYGEGRSVSLFHYKDSQLKHIDSATNIEEFGTGSMGFFYNFICDLCGFDNWKGEEWKVMGLAAYGSKKDYLYDNIIRCIRLDGLNFVRTIHGTRSRLIMQARSPQSPVWEAADMAHNGQLVYEELMTGFLNRVWELKVSNNLVLTGGCGLNSSFNGKILEYTQFKNLYIPSAPADDGNALGAAWLAFHKDSGAKPDISRPLTPFLGSSMSNRSLKYLVQYSSAHITEFQDVNTLVDKTANLLTKGKIVGWIQGQAEFGPRALGNRSILADPRRKDMKDIINTRVKYRESYRPFAPAILQEHGQDYFQRYQPTPYMERTLVFRQTVRDRVPAVVHQDGTGRLQTVCQDWNPCFYKLLVSFYKKTGVPVLLNTSFNVMGKPIVHSVEDAVAVFECSGLDALVIDKHLFLKDTICKEI